MKTKQEIIEYYKKLVDEVIEIDSPVLKLDASISQSHGMYIVLTIFTNKYNDNRSFYIWLRDGFETEPQAEEIKTALELARAGDWQGIKKLSGH